MSKKVGIICVGDELINGYTIDTNSNFIASKIRKFDNLDISNILVVGDDLVSISDNLDYLIGKNINYIFITGGLGPTHDDLTKKVLCEYFNCELKTCEKHYQKLCDKYPSKKKKNIKSQSEILEISQPIPNDIGTALSMYFMFKGITFFILPGVPLEVNKAMVNYILPNYIEPFYKVNNNVLTILTSGIYESSLYNKLKDIIEEWRDKIKVAFLPGYSGVKIRLTSLDSSISKDTFTQFKNLVEYKIKKYIYGYDDDKLNQIIGEILSKERKTLAVAESCTGGYLSKVITDIPGSSSYFKGGIVSYSNDMKVKILGINNDVINEYGAVSKEVAVLMSENIRKKCNSDYGISTTGIAGPTGGSSDKPVGRVYISISTKKNTICKEFTFSDQRKINRNITIYISLFLLKKSIEIKK